MALGECKDWSEAVRRVVHWDRTVEPNPANHAIYDEAYPRWFKVYQHMLPIADEGLLPSLWRAPGV
jgi:autoinducer 2 (AI-2) kinase